MDGLQRDFALWNSWKVDANVTEAYLIDYNSPELIDIPFNSIMLVIDLVVTRQRPAQIHAFDLLINGQTANGMLTGNLLALSFDTHTRQMIQDEVIAPFQLMSPLVATQTQRVTMPPSVTGFCPSVAELVRTNYQYFQFYTPVAGRSDLIILNGYANDNRITLARVSAAAAMYQRLMIEVLTEKDWGPIPPAGAESDYQYHGPAHSPIRPNIDYHRIFRTVVNYVNITSRDWPSGTNLLRHLRERLKLIRDWADGHATWREAQAKGHCPVEPLSLEEIEVIRILGSSSDGSNWGILPSSVRNWMKAAHVAFLLEDPIHLPHFWRGAAVYEYLEQAQTAALAVTVGMQNHLGPQAQGQASAFTSITATGYRAAPYQHQGQASGPVLGGHQDHSSGTRSYSSESDPKDDDQEQAGTRDLGPVLVEEADLEEFIDPALARISDAFRASGI